MRLILMRHGIAADPMDPRCPPDRERPLTEKGARRTRAAAEGLRSLGAVPDVVFTSPLRRAVQTAEIVADVMDCPRVERVEALAGGVRTRDVFDLLATQPADATICCVGHAPQLDLLLVQSLGSDQPEVAKLKKAGAACVEFDLVAPSAGRLLWLMAPRALRRLAAEGS